MPTAAPAEWSVQPRVVWMRLVRRVITLGGHAICRVRRRVEGGAHVERAVHPTIFAANHRSILDTPMILDSLPPRVRNATAVVAAAEVFAYRPEGSPVRRLRRRFVASLVERGYSAIMVDRRSGADGYRATATAIRLGWNVLMYPEGTRSRSGSVGPFQTGVALLAGQVGASVVPIWIEGSEGVLPVGCRWPQRGTILVRFGEPLRCEDGETPERFTQRLREAIGALDPCRVPVAAATIGPGAERGRA